MLEITGITAGSPAAIIGLQKDDVLLTINGQPINDIIDYRFHEADSYIDLEVKRIGKVIEFTLEKEIDQSLGLAFKPDRIRRCRNKCVFCFCHNNPKQLRRALYVKDDDYRHSFLFGNFITLTNLSDEDIKRIISLRLSPLYVSVHAIDTDVRRQLFGKDQAASVMPIIKRLTENGIQLHCQVVVVPGLNDGEILRKTAADLAKLRPMIASLAVVPVGLTKYSEKSLQAVGPKRALALIEDVEKFRRRYGSRYDHFAYAADELFIKADRKIPSASYYDEFPQIENGVGLVRDFLDGFPGRIKHDIKGIWITAPSMINVWRKHILPRYNIKINLIVVSNGLFGNKVTVTGLLPGQDIINRLKKRKLNNTPVVLPPNCLNSDGLFIDDVTVPEMEAALQAKVVQGDYSFKETLRRLS
jgi:putative radical SAM enzyme (TIGR03279 family)